MIFVVRGGYGLGEVFESRREISLSFGFCNLLSLNVFLWFLSCVYYNVRD